MIFDEPQPDEYGLIYDAWANSFRKSPWAGCVPNHLWDAVSRASMTEILNRSRIIVAAIPLDEGEGRRVMGYSVSEPGRNILHWLYVKADYRGVGIGRRLLAETHSRAERVGEWQYTHRTKASARFLGPGFVWSPHLVRVKQ